MKQFILSLAIGMLAITGAKAQPVLTVNNNSCADVFVDFYCRSFVGCGGPIVSTSGAIITSGTVGATFDATAIYGSPLPSNHAWRYGLVGDPGGCAPIAPGGGCAGHLIQMTDGGCTGGPALTSGCVNIDGGGCQAGCAPGTFLNVTATFFANGDCTLDIN